MENKYLEDIQEIKNLMNRATGFISLSGLSGVSIGITALIGAFLANETIYGNEEYLVYNAVEISSKQLLFLLLLAFGTLIVAMGNAIYFTQRKTKRQDQPAWNIQSKRLLINLFIPLITGGILCLMFLFKGFVGVLPSLTLIFYGLALVNGSKYTLPEIRSLGIIQILLGLLAFQFVSYGIFFWAAGFGVVQIVYGIIIQRKY